MSGGGAAGGGGSGGPSEAVRPSLSWAAPHIALTEAEGASIPQIRGAKSSKVQHQQLVLQDIVHYICNHQRKPQKERITQWA